jgi:hypothetical protein
MTHKTCLRGFGANGSIAWTSAVSQVGRTSNVRVFKVIMKLETFLFQMVVTSCISVQYLWKYGFAKYSDNSYAPCIYPFLLRETSGGSGAPPDWGLKAMKYHNKLRILLHSLARHKKRQEGRRFLKLWHTALYRKRYCGSYFVYAIEMEKLLNYSRTHHGNVKGSGLCILESITTYIGG